MGTTRKPRKSRRNKNRQVSQAALGRPCGVIHQRVRGVGPEHFGIVAVDCAKARSKWMLCDFYGKVLIPPTEVEHQKAQLKLATSQLRDACEQHQLRDHIVAVEMTGTYHRIVQRAFRKAGSETRLVHPFASRHYRLPDSADIKTDDKDLAGIFRAAVNGFGLLEPAWDDIYLQLQLLARHRRDLVNKRSKLQCQIRNYLECCLPGYAAIFPDDDLWTRPIAMPLAQKFGSAKAVLAAGVKGVTEWKEKEKIHCQSRTIDRVLAWAGNAADADPLGEPLARIWHALHDDWKAKAEQITQIERELADNLIKCNAHYRGKFQLWKQQNVDSRDIRCRIANRAMRSVFQIVSGRRLYHHPSRLDRTYVLDKLLTFHQEHNTSPEIILRDLQCAAEMIPQNEQAAEAAPLQARYEKCRRSRRKAAAPIGEILLAVLARYGITGLECEESQGSHANRSDTSN